MKLTNIGGFKNIDEFVAYKIEKLEKSDKSMSALFELMFSEKENVMFEETDGFKINKTTYGEAYESVLSLSSALKNELGDEKSGTVGIYMENSPEWIEVFWAVLRAGYCPLLLNMRMPQELLNSVIEQNRVCAVVSDKKTFSVKTIEISELKEKSKKVEDRTENAVFGEEMFVMSSGTTDSVKICAYSAKELSVVIKNSSYVLSKNKRIKEHFDGRLKLLAFLPFYHIFGFVAVYLWFGFFSRTFVKLGDLNPQTILNTIKKHRVTHIFAVPLFWETVYRKAIEKISERGAKTLKKFEKGIKISESLGNSAIGKAFSKKAFYEVRENIFGESVKFMITGGSVISPEVVRFFNGIGYYLVNGYGMSEIGIASVELSENRKIINSCSVGFPLPSAEYKTGDDGELYVKGTSLAKYVVVNGEKEIVQGEWFKTNDSAYEHGGRYFINGRRDDVIVSATGENLNPEIIEQNLVVANSEGVCLIDDGNKLPTLLVSVKKSLKKSDAEQLLVEIRKKLSEQNLSASIGNVTLISEPLIKGDEFKPNRKRIRKEYCEGKLKKYSFALKRENEVCDEITEKVREYFAIAFGKNASEIDIDGDFFLDDGGTSLDYFALLSEIGRNFGMNIPASGEYGLTTVVAIADYIRERQ